MTSSTAAILEARSRVNANRQNKTTSRNGYGPEHQHSKSRSAICNMAIYDMVRNGFEVQCKDTGIKFTIIPGSPLCDMFTSQLEQYWVSGGQ